GNLRLYSGQTLQERQDRIRLLIGKMQTDLARAHDGDRLAQIPRFAAVKIGRRQGDVAESGDLEDVFVGRALRNHKTPLVIWRQNRRVGSLDDTKRSVHPATHVDAAVARGTPLVHE